MSGLARLSPATLTDLPPDVLRPAYDRERTKIGVLHFGPGAFHRAHQAAAFDTLLTRDPRWAISAVSLNSAGVRDALAPQDGLYTLVELDAQVRRRVIGALREVIVAPEDPAAVFARLTHPDLRLITLTATEKGYRLAADGTLDLDHPDIRRDLAAPTAPQSLIGWLSEGLRRRRAAGLPPPMVISCDNLADNGAKLHDAVTAFARHVDADLAAWIAGEVRFPRTMVDSITPATDDALRARVDASLGVHDAWPIQREAFTQWIIEDLGATDGPDWAAAGTTLSRDVGAYEQAKLRLLNGAHSCLAYLGLLEGVETVAEAMARPELAAFVERLMRQDIAPTLRPPPELDVDAYVAAVLARFRNPAIAHKLSQIAWDGSQKLPIRLLATLSDALAAGQDIDRLARPIAAWMRFVARRARTGEAIVDPLADKLVEVGRACIGVGRGDTPRFLAMDAVFPRALAAHGRVRDALSLAYDALPA